MATRRPTSSVKATEPVRVSELLNEALKHLKPAIPSANHNDGIIYTGNRHESVPRALFLDRRLTPLERNAWQVFRMLLNDTGLTTFPTYERLRPYLTSTPCSGRASDETIARTLTLLRLTRWLTMARHRRDPKTGRMQGNLYILHDEPLTPYEAIQLDPRYLELVSHALTHVAKAVQIVARYVLQEIADDPMLADRILPSRIQTLLQRLSGPDWLAELPPSESEEGQNVDETPLRIPKTDSTVRTKNINNYTVRTVPRARDPSHLRLPAQFASLRAEQQECALVALQQVEIALQQPVLDEWAARCDASTVRNPSGYLFGLVQKALRGEFRAWASERTPRHSKPKAEAPSPKAAEHTEDDKSRRDNADRYIAKLRETLRPR